MPNMSPLLPITTLLLLTSVVGAFDNSTNGQSKVSPRAIYYREHAPKLNLTIPKSYVPRTREDFQALFPGISLVQALKMPTTTTTTTTTTTVAPVKQATKSAKVNVIREALSSSPIVHHQGSDEDEDEEYFGNKDDDLDYEDKKDMKPNTPSYEDKKNMRPNTPSSQPDNNHNNPNKDDENSPLKPTRIPLPSNTGPLIWDPICEYSPFWAKAMFEHKFPSLHVDDEFVFEPQNAVDNCTNVGEVWERPEIMGYNSLWNKLDSYNSANSRQVFDDYWNNNASGTAFMLNLYALFQAKKQAIFNPPEPGTGPYDVLHSGYVKYDLNSVLNSDWIVSYQNKVKLVRDPLSIGYIPWKYTQTWFNITDVPLKMQPMDLFSAHIYYYRDYIMGANPFHIYWTRDVFNFRVSVYDVKNFKLGRSKPLDEMVINFNDFGWFRFDITKAALKWAKSPKDNMGIYMRITNEGTNEEIRIRHVGFIMNTFATKQYTPFVVGHYRMKTPDLWNHGEFRQRRRHKRKLSDFLDYECPDIKTITLKERRRQPCNLYPLEVAFLDLNLTSNYYLDVNCTFTINACLGLCRNSFPPDVVSSNNAMIKSLLLTGFKKPKEEIFNPVSEMSCAPASYLPGLFLYRNEQQELSIRVVKDLIAESCACG